MLVEEPGYSLDGRVLVKEPVQPPSLQSAPDSTREESEEALETDQYRNPRNINHCHIQSVHAFDDPHHWYSLV